MNTSAGTTVGRVAMCRDAAHDASFPDCYKYAKMGRVHVTVGMGTFLCVPKLPSVDSMQMQSSKIL